MFKVRLHNKQKSFPENGKDLQARIVQYQTLLEIGKELLTESDIDRMLTLAMDHLIENTGAERGMIILFDEDGNNQFATARNLKKQDIENPKFEVSKTIIDNVHIKGTPICLSNALENPLLRKSDSTANLRILSVACLPLHHKGQIFGVIYLDNRSLWDIFKQDVRIFIETFVDFISLASFHALDRSRIHNRQELLEEELRTRYDFEAILGHSPKILKVLHIISQVADTEAPVLIEGESGTGKELVARAIHFNSRRRGMPLVSVNCAAIPDNLLESELFGHERGAFTGACRRHKGKFEQADGGTIFLDEVDEMSPALQVKLLRILQWGDFSPLGSDITKRCNVRIVAASKQVVRKLVKEGNFRDDLYYRLNLIRIEMPPLRDRKDDILLLTDYFLQSACKKLSKPVPTLSLRVEHVLQDYYYPGNVRELENVIRHAAILCRHDTIEIEHLPPELLPNHRFVETESATMQTFQEAKRKTIEEFERRYINNILNECDGIICRAAKRAGIQEKNFHEKLKKYAIHGIKTKLAPI